MNVEIIELTPAKAEELLKMNVGNRKLRQKLVTTYTKDMLEGRWHANGEPIIISSNGRLISGQHRCHAVIKSGVTLKNTVLITTDDPEMIDTGAVRTVQDLSNISNVASAAIAIAIQMSLGAVGVPTSKALIIQKYEDWKSSCDWVCSFFQNSRITGLRKSSIVGAILVAHLYGYPEDRLEYFCKTFISGMMNCPEDKVVILLRNLAISTVANSSGYRKELYLKTQAALKIFLEQRCVNKLYALAKPCYTVDIK